jgi:hypothetical protein
MPEIPLGDVVRKFRLPGWLRRVLGFLKGTRISRGDITIVLQEDAKGEASRPTSPLERPHRVAPPKIGGRR